MAKARRKDIIQLFLVGRALKQFVDIITMNASHHTKFEHAYVLDVHFSKSAKTTIESDVTAASTRERDCFYYIIIQTYDAGLHSRRHPVEFDAGTRPFASYNAPNS